MTIFFTSDLHFGHKNIIDFCNRPFKDVNHMNRELIRRWNEVVTPDDTVIVLGDVVMGVFAKEINNVRELAGTKFLVPGNHDRCSSLWKKQNQNWSEVYENVGFTIWPEICSLVLPYNEPTSIVKLSHFPYEGDSHDEDRYKDNRPEDVGDWLIHGHVHDKWKVNGRQINVGVDVWDFYPVHEGEIHKIIVQS